MRRFADDGSMLDVSDRLDELVRRFRDEPGLAALILYGSYGTALQTPLSDIDLAVVFREDAVPSTPDRLRLTGMAVGALAEADVSLAFLNRSPLPFQHEVLRTGRPLLVVDDVALADFRERVVDRYCDFVIDYQVILADYDEALREAYGAGRS